MNLPQWGECLVVSFVFSSSLPLRVADADAFSATIQPLPFFLFLFVLPSGGILLKGRPVSQYLVSLGARLPHMCIVK